MDQDEDEVLDIPDENEGAIPDGFHATDPETGLPIPEVLDDEEDEEVVI